MAKLLNHGSRPQLQGPLLDMCLRNFWLRGQAVKLDVRLHGFEKPARAEVGHARA